MAVRMNALVLGLAALLTAVPGSAEPWRGPALEASLSESTRTALLQADALYAARDRSGNDLKALESLRAASKAAPSYDVWWRLSRAAWWLGERTGDKARLRALALEGRAAADEALKLRPQGAEGLYFRALSVGSYSSAVGLFTALREGLEAQFRDPLLQLSRSTPALDNGGVFNALGRYKFSLPWPKRDYDQSAAWLRRAQELQPTNLRGRVYLAETLAARDAPGDIAEARRLLAEVRTAPTGRYDTAEELHAKELGRALEARLGTSP